MEWEKSKKLSKELFGENLSVSVSVSVSVSKKN